MNAERCPRCGQPNRCAQAGEQQPVQDCWCFHAPLEHGALDALPAEQFDRTCLCPDCLRALAGKGEPG